MGFIKNKPSLSLKEGKRFKVWKNLKNRVFRGEKAEVVVFGTNRRVNMRVRYIDRTSNPHEGQRSSFILFKVGLTGLGELLNYS